jgi:hypothetical protein
MRLSNAKVSPDVAFCVEASSTHATIDFALSSDKAVNVSFNASAPSDEASLTKCVFGSPADMSFTNVAALKKNA